MPALRAVPHLTATSPRDSAAFSTSIVGLDVAIDHGWIVALTDPTDAAVTTV